MKKQTILNMLFGVGLALVTGVVVLGVELGLAYGFTFLLKERVNESVWNAIYQALVYLLTILILLGLPKLIKRLAQFRVSREEMGLRGLPTWTDIGLSVVGLLAYFVLAGMATYVFTQAFSWFNAEQTQDVGFNNLYVATDRMIAFVSLVVIAPIAEEMIFRGWLYGKLRARMSLVPAMLIVSLLFGLLHGQWNVGVNVFALSLVLCGLREITGTTYAGILVHMLKNGIAFYLLYIVGM